ncbi:MAG: hypothetical protein AAGI30_04145 [Planctomycetota bacterium]
MATLPVPPLYSAEPPMPDRPERISLVPGPDGFDDPDAARGRIRLMWGQPMLADVLAWRYRAVICGVNDEDNAHGIITQLVEHIATSQWTGKAVTSYASVFLDAISDHAADDDEPYILKYDLDRVLVLALLRPSGRDFFTIDDLGRGFRTVVKMLEGRRDRSPVASVSFLGARSNRLVTSLDDEREPAFETVLATMHDAGFRGDVYPPHELWSTGDTPVFPSYPFVT